MWWKKYFDVKVAIQQCENTFSQVKVLHSEGYLSTITEVFPAHSIKSISIQQANKKPLSVLYYWIIITDHFNVAAD